MNIIIVGTAYPLRGGIAHYNALLAEHLSQRHAVSTVTFKRQYPTILFPGKTQDEIGGRSHARPAPQLLDSVNPFNWIAVARTIRRQSPDLVIFKYWLPFFGPCFGTVAKLVKRKSSTKVLFICDNVIPHERRFGDVAFTKYAFRQVDYFIVQSDTVERDLQKRFPGATYRKVPHPVYENFGDPIPKQRARQALGIATKNVLLYFGYVRRYKGLLVLIDAMRALVDRSGDNADILLLIVGEFYDDESKYRSRVKELHLERHIRFVSEYVQNEKVATYFSAADVVVLPYLSATQSGIAQIAFHFDKPVIATNVGGLAEVVDNGRTGFIVPAQDSRALAAAIDIFFAEQKGEEFSRRVKEEKKKYSWDHLVQAIEELVAES